MFDIMKEPRVLVLLLGLITITTQDVAKKKDCNCKCKQAGTLVNPVVSLYFQNEDKPGCNICEQRKEMLRKEKEKELQFQKCPFEILGTPLMKEKTSEELFDGFRELLVPSQNGFFDMLRGVVKTMHVSSESELKWAKEKEAKLLAQRKIMMEKEERERRIQEEQRKAEEEAAAKEGEKSSEPRRPPSIETSPFLRALFRKKEPSNEPLKIDLSYGIMQTPSEEKDLNLQKLDSEKDSKEAPDRSSEKTDATPPPVVSKRITKDDLLDMSSTCKKEKDILKLLKLDKH